MKIKLLSIILVLGHQFVSAQNGKAALKFGQGQKFDISTRLNSTISQQAMGQAIDFSVNATGDHHYTVTNATDDNTTLHHNVSRLRFSFDGMGQKRTFDSNEEKDMNGPFGGYAKEILGKSYDMIIDPKGQTLMAIPEKISIAETDARMAIISTMLKDVVSMVYPPKKDEPGFFQLFPDEAVAPGLTWTRNVQDSSGRISEIYKITEMNDSSNVIIIDYTAESVTITKAEMMGNETITTMNNKSTGKIIVDRATGILREKNIKTESNGSSEAPFGTIPVTSKSEIIILVTPVQQ